MPMTPISLANEITDAMGFPAPPSPQLIGWATGCIIELSGKGLATTGGIPGPHKITGISGPSMAAIVASVGGYGLITPQLIGECTGIMTHIMTAANVVYVAPPPVAGNPDWFIGGKISGMSGPAMATLVALFTGFPIPTPDLIKKCTAIVDHIEKNALVNNGKIQ